MRLLLLRVTLAFRCVAGLADDLSMASISIGVIAYRC